MITKTDKTRKSLVFIILSQLGDTKKGNQSIRKNVSLSVSFCLIWRKENIHSRFIFPIFFHKGHNLFIYKKNKWVREIRSTFLVRIKEINLLHLYFVLWKYITHSIRSFHDWLSIVPFENIYLKEKYPPSCKNKIWNTFPWFLLNFSFHLLQYDICNWFFLTRINKN
jgi:hypothetical protein